MTSRQLTRFISHELDYALKLLEIDEKPQQSSIMKIAENVEFPEELQSIATGGISLRNDNSITPEIRILVQTICHCHQLDIVRIRRRDSYDLLAVANGESITPRLGIRIGNLRTEALIDSGASHNYIAYDILSRIGFKQYRIRPMKSDRIVGTASGTLVPIGRINLLVQWAGNNTLTQFTLLPTQMIDVVLGCSFIATVGLLPSVRDRMFYSQLDHKLEIPFHSYERIDHNMDKVCTLSMELSNTDLTWSEILVNAADCSDNQRMQLKDLVLQFADVLSNKPGCTHVAQHRIELTKTPKKCPFRMFNPSKRAIILGLVQELLNEGIIERSDSDIVSYPVIVPKPNKTYRMCIDYRWLNEATRIEAIDMPEINMLIAHIGRAKFFTSFDLVKGYYQVLMCPEDKHKTAFWTPMGQMQFVRMPFGLCNAPATFQKLMTKVLSTSLYIHCMVYLDDIVVFSQTWEEHLIHIADVLEKLRTANLTASLEKSKLCRSKLLFLGFVIDQEGLRVNPSKLEAIEKFPSPTTKTEVKRFLGLTGFFRKFVKNFANIAAPLHALSTRIGSFELNTVETEAFNRLKTILLKDIVLIQPELNKPFTIQTDASHQGLGAVLLQEVEVDRQMRLKPIAFASRTLRGAETKYSTPELECLAVVWAVNRFRPFLEYTTFTIECDAMALKWLMTTPQPSGRFGRWAIRLQSGPFKINYRAGKFNKVADALSRAPINELLPEDHVEIEEVPQFWIKDKEKQIEKHSENNVLNCLQQEKFEDRIKTFNNELFFTDETTRELPTVCNAVTPYMAQVPPSREEIIKAQWQHFEYIQLMEYLLRGILPRDEILAKQIEETSTAFCLEQEDDEHQPLLLKFCPLDEEELELTGKGFKVVVPPCLRKRVMFACHGHPISGHQGIFKTVERIKEIYFWPNINADVRRFVRGCQICQMHKPRQQKAIAGAYIPGGIHPPWEVIAVDLMGPKPMSSDRKRWLLVIIDCSTKFVELFALGKATGTIVAEKIKEVACRYGFPKRIISDNGVQFISTVYKKFCERCNIRSSLTSTYHPSANPTERVNRDIKFMISMFIDIHKHWTKHLVDLAFSLRARRSEATGYSPGFLNFGHIMNNPFDPRIASDNEYFDPENPEIYVSRLIERIRIAYSNMCKKLQSNYEKHNKIHEGKFQIEKFEIGDWVWKKTHFLSDAESGFSSTLAPIRDGPWEVLEVLFSNSYKLKNLKDGRIEPAVNITHLTLYVPELDINEWTSTQIEGDELSPASSDPIVSTNNAEGETQVETGSSAIHKRARDLEVDRDVTTNDNNNTGARPKRVRKPNQRYSQDFVTKSLETKKK